MTSWASRLLADLDPLYFPMTPAEYAVKASRGRWGVKGHLQVLNDALVRVAAGDLQFLMVDMPPRHGKSEFVSKYFAAWYLGTFPDRRVILTSYEADYAAKWGRKARDLLEETGPTYFGEPVHICQDSKSASRWDIDGHDGGMVTAGTGGPITGQGGHLIIIDDPVKNAQQANSKTYRDNADEWYKSTLYTRLEPGGAIILVMTRWNKDDLAGRRLAEMEADGDQWEVINFPAIAEDHDILGRVPGEPLWPERYPLERLKKIKRTLGPYWWNALYQQNPGDPEGTLFKRQFFRYYERDGDRYVLHAPEGDKRWHVSNCTTFQTCDPAGSTKAFADYFALATWAATPHNELLLLDIIRDRLEGPDQPEIFRSAYDRWRPVAQGVESKNMGLTLFQTLQRTALPVEELKPDGDKITRARPMAARYKSGMVYHPKNAPWLGDYEEELIGFPNAGHDDQVDVASYAYVMLMDLDRYRPSRYNEGDFFL